MRDGMKPDISVVILSWNTLDLTRACLRELGRCRADSDLSYQIIVIENASVDGSLEMIRDEFPGVELYRNDEHQGYARGVNQGLRLARGRFVVLL
ncbi:MAG: glycosyltransferase, partial [Salinibacterium sp.]|nr:glycosyltransferase [Salinibacterium sp.]